MVSMTPLFSYIISYNVPSQEIKNKKSLIRCIVQPCYFTVRETETLYIAEFKAKCSLNLFTQWRRRKKNSLIVQWKISCKLSEKFPIQIYLKSIKSLNLPMKRNKQKECGVSLSRNLFHFFFFFCESRILWSCFVLHKNPLCKCYFLSKESINLWSKKKIVNFKSFQSEVWGEHISQKHKSVSNR